MNLGALLVILMYGVDLAAIAWVHLRLARRFGIERTGRWPWSRSRTPSHEVWRGARATMIAACAGATYAVSVVLFAGGLFLSGDYVMTGRVDVVPGGSADAAGMRTDDTIVSIEGVAVKEFADIRRTLDQSDKATVQIRALRNGAEMVFEVTPRDQVRRIGVLATSDHRDLSFIAALGHATYKPMTYLASVAELLHQLFLGKLYGPRAGYSFAREAQAAVDKGAGFTLLFLGCVNTFVWPFFIALSCFLVLRRDRSRSVPKAGDEPRPTPKAKSAKERASRRSSDQ